MDFIKKNREGIIFLSGFGSAFSCFGKIVSGRPVDQCLRF